MSLRETDTAVQEPVLLRAGEDPNVHGKISVAIARRRLKAHANSLGLDIGKITVSAWTRIALRPELPPALWPLACYVTAPITGRWDKDGWRRA